MVKDDSDLEQTFPYIGFEADLFSDALNKIHYIDRQVADLVVLDDLSPRDWDLQDSLLPDSFEGDGALRSSLESASLPCTDKLLETETSQRHIGLLESRSYNVTVKKPKRSLSAYNFFFQAERQRLLEALPERCFKPRRSQGKMGFTDLARNVACKWKSLGVEDRMEFEQLAALDGERYEIEMAHWRTCTGTTAEKNKKIKSSIVSIKSDIVEESMEYRDSRSVSTESNIINTSTEFDDLSLDALFAEESFIDCVVGFPEIDPENISALLALGAPVMEEESSLDDDGQTEQETCVKIEAKRKPRKTCKKKSDGKKSPRALSAYNIFFRAEREKLLESLPARENKPRRSHGKIGFAEMARTIAAKWKNITPEEKMHYEHLSALDAERYENEKKALASTPLAIPESPKSLESTDQQHCSSINEGCVSMFLRQHHEKRKEILCRNQVEIPATAPGLRQQGAVSSSSIIPRKGGCVSKFLCRQLLKPALNKICQ